MKKLSLLNILFLLFFSASVYAATAAAPTLPQVYITTTYSAPTGGTCNASNTAEFTACLASAALDSTIVLTAGTTYIAPADNGWVLPNKTTGSGWIYIISSNLANLPEGTRVGPSDASDMPKLEPYGSGANRVFTTATSAHHFRLAGLEIRADTGETNSALMILGPEYDDDADDTTIENNITIDRCYVHGDATVGSVRGIWFSVAYGAVIDSYFTDFMSSGQDTQTIWAYETPGPLKIVNNYLAATGENIMFGGTDNDAADLIPQDIEIKRNHFIKPLAWKDAGWVVKNLLESKMSLRVLVEGNIFENDWHEDQDTSINLKSEDQDGGGNNAWAETRDWTIRYNKIINVGNVIKFYPQGDNPGVDANTISFNNNLVIVNATEQTSWAIYNHAVDNISIYNNTFVNANAAKRSIYMENYLGTGVGFDFLNNIIPIGAGMRADGYVAGTASFAALYPGGYLVEKNAIIRSGGDPGGYPANNFWPVDTAAIGFVNYTGDEDGNYRLASGSTYENAGTDGKDLGADIDALEAALAGEEDTPSTIIKKIMNFFRRLRG